MHKQIRVLTIVFGPEIKGGQVRKFRGAIINKVGRDCVLFHNHLDEREYNHRYPLIQYKRIRRHAAIVCIEEGVDEIYRLFNQPDWRMKIGEDEVELRIKQLKVNKYTMNVWDRSFEYRIFNWLALNSKNYKLFQNQESLAGKIRILEQVLTSNILSFAKGIGWTIPQDAKIQINIKDIVNKKVVEFRGALYSAFDIDFSTNVFLPENISLGKAASHGFGMVRRLRKYKPQTKIQE